MLAISRKAYFNNHHLYTSHKFYYLHTLKHTWGPSGPHHYIQMTHVYMLSKYHSQSTISFSDYRYWSVMPETYFTSHKYMISVANVHFVSTDFGFYFHKGIGEVLINDFFLTSPLCCYTIAKAYPIYFLVI